MRPRRFRVLPALIAVVGVVLSTLTAAPALAASPAASTTTQTGIVDAAAVVGFSAGNIISDSLFYDSAAMTSAEIQSFLDAKIGTCTNGKCINILSASISSRDAVTSQSTGNLICAAIKGGTMKVSELIYRVQVACGISAKVILVMLQKEQGLTTSKAPSDWNLKAAMGASCPDSAPCDPAFSGIGPQIVKGAQQLKTYKAANFAKQPGVHFIAYSPTASCGGKNITIQNYATAALYNYTPYQPNAAALAAGSGLGDACSAYGNRNFYNYYTKWFGSTQSGVDPCQPPAASQVVAAAGEYQTTASLNARSAPTTACDNVLRTLPTGTIVTRQATFGEWWQIRAQETTYWVHSGYLKAAAGVAYSVDRLAGPSRYDTAIEVSKATFPSGAATVLVASGEDFPDALAAGAAAGKADAALLLTETGRVRDAVIAEIVRLKPTKVILVGAEMRVSAAAAAQITAAVPTASIERIAGIDRYETSRLIAQRFFPTATAAYVVTGLNHADAVVAAALGGAKGQPVLLVNGAATVADDATVAYLRGSRITTVTIAGATPAVSAGIEASLKSTGLKVTRVGGVNRYETSVLLNAAAYPSGAGDALFATGSGFADALTGSVLAAASPGPLFITPAQCMADSAKTWLVGKGVQSVVLIGGPPSLSEAVADSVRC